jgi:hypothetical protein
MTVVTRLRACGTWACDGSKAEEEQQRWYNYFRICGVKAIKLVQDLEVGKAGLPRSFCVIKILVV